MKKFVTCNKCGKKGRAAPDGTAPDGWVQAVNYFAMGTEYNLCPGCLDTGLPETANSGRAAV